MECSICTSDNVQAGAYAIPFDLGVNGRIDTHVHRCRSCGVHFRDIDFDSPEVGGHFDVVGYVRNTNRDVQRKAREHFFRYLLAQAARQLGTTRGKRLLDVGCSHGHMMSLFETEGGFSVCGVERNAGLREEYLFSVLTGSRG